MAVNIPPGFDPSQNTRASLNDGELMPRRNPTLIQRIAARIFLAHPNVGPQIEDKTTTETGIIAEGLSSLYDRQFKFDVVRKAVYRDVEEMDTSSAEISVALDTIADNVVSSDDGVQMSFQALSRQPEVQKVLDQVVATCKLHHKIKPMVRNLIKYGDTFVEIVINGNGEVVNFKQIPPITMWRNENLIGQFLMGKPTFSTASGKVVNEPNTCAFDQKAAETGDLMTSFWPWQIVHVRLNHDGFSPYGRSHLRVARIIYRQLKAVEESIIVGRLTRDIMKLVHYVDTTGLSKAQKQIAVRDYMQAVQQRRHVDGARENPYSVMTDFFISTGWIQMGNQVQPTGAKIDIIDPKNIGIHDLTDVEYLHRKLLMTLRIPPSHLGWEKDVNAKSTLTIQDTQYVRMLREIQQLVGHGLEQLFDTALILNGINPEDSEYEILWPQLATTDQLNSAQAEYYRAQADQLYGPEGLKVIDNQWVQMHRFNMSDEEITEINERILEEEKRLQEVAQQNAENSAQMQDKQAQTAHERQLQLAKAKGQPGGFREASPRSPKDKINQGRENQHGKGEDDVPRRSVTQEVKILGSLLGDKVSQSLSQDVERVLGKMTNGNGHDLRLERGLDRLAEVASNSGPKTIYIEAPKSPDVTLETHNHVEAPKIEIPKPDPVQNEVNIELKQEVPGPIVESKTRTNVKYKVTRGSNGEFQFEREN